MAPVPYSQQPPPSSNDTLQGGAIGTNMSFNPYSKVKDVNDTKMSNNEAFLAFLSKNDDDEDNWVNCKGL